MIDVTTNKPLRVKTSTSRSYVSAPASQLDEVSRLLADAQVPHWVAEDVISLNGGPETGFIYLGRAADPAAVQALLDNAR
jgi:hypothetical protein